MSVHGVFAYYSHSGGQAQGLVTRRYYWKPEVAMRIPWSLTIPDALRATEKDVNIAQYRALRNSKNSFL